MKGIVVIVFLLLQVVSWVRISGGRSFAAHNDDDGSSAVHQPSGTHENPRTWEIRSRREEVVGGAAAAAGGGAKEGERIGVEVGLKRRRKVLFLVIGSSPPSCENKCYGCIPCEPTQIPTTGVVTIQYANYQPEGWKCKCGPSFYSP